jgi:gluconate 2-dehydrogenase gamma chain
MKIDRRTLIGNLIRGGLALRLMPGFAESAWSGVAAAGDRAAPRVFDSAQSRMIAIIADTILPRSDTPSATEVGVPAWIDLVVAEYFPEGQRAGFLSDLAAIDELALSTSGAHLAALKGDALGADALALVIANLDAACGTKGLAVTPAQRGYVQLKELIIYGYFTSKTVQQDILKVVIVPGRFDGDVRIAPPSVT